ncbi:uncharacterized protein YALI1_A14430g [Yarrowia lipolytica]|uniref:Uncharacterized protein n=1 Tax=Yarrowia lipolytica TaxID=4952 RepID=A0A1D8N4W3_YARLL|nr:hypothetical protein YALI1_A14430g [Yarrowia lipolytica]
MEPEASLADELKRLLRVELAPKSRNHKSLCLSPHFGEKERGWTPREETERDRKSLQTSTTTYQTDTDTQEPVIVIPRTRHSHPRSRSSTRPPFQSQTVPCLTASPKISSKPDTPNFTLTHTPD